METKIKKVFGIEHRISVVKILDPSNIECKISNVKCKKVMVERNHGFKELTSVSHNSTYAAARKIFSVPRCLCGEIFKSGEREIGLCLALASSEIKSYFWPLKSNQHVSSNYSCIFRRTGNHHYCPDITASFRRQKKSRAHEGIGKRHPGIQRCQQGRRGE